ncbi:MAG: hypothetical protein K6G50_00125 [bacterium]|nr:hypothetical protein [bacterium]
MQLYCPSCLEPVSEEDTICPRCGDSSHMPQTFAELPPSDKVEIFRRTKANLSSAILFVLAFLVPSLLILFVSYKYARDFSEIIAFLYFGAIGYCYNHLDIDSFIDKIAAQGKLSEAKGYFVAKKWCLMLGILIITALFVISYI